MLHYLFGPKNVYPVYKYCGLFEVETKTLLVLGTNFNAMNFLKEWVSDAMAFDLPINNRFDDSVQKSIMKGKEFYKFTWNFKLSIFESNKILTEEIIQKSLVLSKKYECLIFIMNFIEIQRSSNKKTMAFQEFIYMAKKNEALTFTKLGYPDKDILEYPYILQYAKYKNINYSEAAKSILFKSKLSEGVLVKTEALRLKYFNLIRSAKTVEEVVKINADFLLDYSQKVS
jgi:hypothetical protein